MKYPSRITTYFAVAILLLLAACALAPPSGKPGVDHRTLNPVSFDDLPDWQNDQFVDALGAFLHSCTSLSHNPKTTSWQDTCAKARQVSNDNDAARLFFEQNFTPYAVSNTQGSEGLFTGYYAPELRGSLQRQGIFQTPLYARPSDLISVDLGLFKSELKGQHIVGKVADTKLVPYDKRGEIVKNGLTGRAQVLAWVDDPVSAFFLQIQGSGRIRLADGRIMPIGYDGANGQAYVSIGHILADRGELQKPITMPAIKSWMTTHPERAQEVMNMDTSYVFFRLLPNEDVLGSEGVALTAGRSLAVDATFMPLGAPLWLDTTDGNGNNLRRLVIAQDTGGAIKGVVRGDFFWGAGDNAAQQAGAMQSQGHYYLLLPKGVAVNDAL